MIGGAGADLHGAGSRIDLGRIDFRKLEERFRKGRGHTAAQRLQRLLHQRVEALVARNRARVELTDRLESLIEEYDRDSANVEEFFRRLLEFSKSLSQEEQGHIAENLSEDELAIFELLMRPAPPLTAKEVKQIKRVAKDLLSKLRAEKLVLDWRRRQQTRAASASRSKSLSTRCPRPSTGNDMKTSASASTSTCSSTSVTGPGSTARTHRRLAGARAAPLPWPRSRSGPVGASVEPPMSSLTPDESDPLRVTVAEFERLIEEGVLGVITPWSCSTG